MGSKSEIDRIMTPMFRIEMEFDRFDDQIHSVQESIHKQLRGNYDYSYSAITLSSSNDWDEEHRPEKGFILRLDIFEDVNVDEIPDLVIPFKNGITKISFSFDTTLIDRNNTNSIMDSVLHQLHYFIIYNNMPNTSLNIDRKMNGSILSLIVSITSSSDSSYSEDTYLKLDNLSKLLM